MHLRMLLVNDDGIAAPGLRAIYEAMAQRHEVLVVAPESERSAFSHATTLGRPLSVSPAPEFGPNAYKCEGAPADCTRIGLCLAMQDGNGVECVVSGMNNGENAALDCHYSGTVSAAMEAAFHGVPSLAVSVADRNPIDWPGAAAYAVRVAEAVATGKLPRTMLSLNLPNLPAEAYGSLVYAPMTWVQRQLTLEMVEGVPGNGLHNMKDPRQESGEGEGGDLDMLRKGHPVLTPLGWDFTAHDCHEDTERLIRHINDF